MQWTEKEQGTKRDEKTNRKQMSCTEPFPRGVVRLEGKLHRVMVNESGHAEICYSLYFLYVVVDRIYNICYNHVCKHIYFGNIMSD